MPRFIDTLGNSSLAIFICGRCKFKRAIDEAMPDPNFPGLIVCQQGCADVKDPYRLPARKTERITLRYPRPDDIMEGPPDVIVTGDYGGMTVSPQANNGVIPGNGNLDNIKP